MLFFIFIFFKISNHIFRKVLIWFYHIFRKILVWIYHIFRIFAPLKFKILTYRILKLFYYIICLINEFNIRIKNNWGNFTLEELIKKAKNGDKGAFTDLIINIQDELYKIARMRLSSEEDIDDAIQETMISAFYGIKHLKHTQYFKTWIIKILINKCNTLYKKRKKLDSYYDDNFINNSIIDFKENNIESNIDFYILIKDLDYIERYILILYYEMGYSCKEISNILSINENTLKTKISRSKEKIKKIIDKN